MLLALDPSSTRTGYAVFRDPEPLGLVESGALIPLKTDRTPLDRISTMAVDLKDIINQHTPTEVIVEIPSRHVSARHGGHGAGLATYGFAAGWLSCLVSLLTDPRSITWVDNGWTKKEPAQSRAARMALLFTHYEPAEDPGFDEADALGLGLWHGTRTRILSNTTDETGNTLGG